MTYTADSSVTIPVVFLGPTAPVAGDYAVANAVGGRWVADQIQGSSGLVCTPCNIPKQNLTLTVKRNGVLNAFLTGNGVITYFPSGTSFGNDTVYWRHGYPEQVDAGFTVGINCNFQTNKIQTILDPPCVKKQTPKGVNP